MSSLKPTRVIAYLLLVTIVSGAWWLSAPFRRDAEGQSPSPTMTLTKTVSASWKPEVGGLLFIAVMGSDAREGAPDAGGGCDAIHILAINPQQKAGTILNFPRDSYLEGGKMTDHCRRSGFPASVGILERHTGIKTQYMLRTEFSHFMRLIDELGGMQVDIPHAMNDVASGAYFQPGSQHLNGGQVLAFSRNRKDTRNGDFSRTEHQGIIIQNSLRKFRQDAQSLHNILGYFRVAQRHVSLNVPPGELMKLALLAREIDPANLRNVNVPGRTGNVGAASVVFLEPGDTYARVLDDGIF